MQIHLEDTFLDNIELHKDFFISAIAHDHRGGRRVLHFGRYKTVRRFSGTSAENLCRKSDTGKCEDSYISFNSFSKSSNKAEDLYNRAGIYVDVDGHDLSQTELDAEKEKFLSCFCKAVNDSFLPVPTFVNDTGRGFAIFYILDRSISVQNKSCHFLDALQGVITSRIADVVNSNEVRLSVDLSVDDVSRIVRLPGTYNTAAENWCRIIFADMDEEDERKIRYTSTDELARGGAIFSSENRKKYRKKLYYQLHGKKEKLNRYLNSTAKDLTRLLLENTAENSTGCRETLLFLIYNQLVQIMKREYAADYIEKLNELLPLPLCNREIKHLMDSVNNCPDLKDGSIRGFYILRREVLIAKANLTPQECKERGILLSAKAASRLETKQRNKKAREDRNMQILEMAKDHTYAEVAEAFHLSVPHVKKILKTLNFRKYSFLPISQIEFRSRRAAEGGNSVSARTVLPALSANCECVFEDADTADKAKREGIDSFKEGDFISKAGLFISGCTGASAKEGVKDPVFAIKAVLSADGFSSVPTAATENEADCLRAYSSEIKGLEFVNRSAMFTGEERSLMMKLLETGFKKETVLKLIDLERSFGIKDGICVASKEAAKEAAHRRTPEMPYSTLSYVPSGSRCHKVTSFYVPSEYHGKDKKIRKSSKRKKKPLCERAADLGYLPDEYFLCLKPAHVRALHLIKSRLDTDDMFIPYTDRLLALTDAYAIPGMPYIYIPTYLLSGSLMAMLLQNASLLGDMCQDRLLIPVNLGEVEEIEEDDPEAVAIDNSSYRYDLRNPWDRDFRRALLEYENHLAGLDQDFTTPVRFMTLAEIDKEHGGLSTLPHRIDM